MSGHGSFGRKRGYGTGEFPICRRCGRDNHAEVDCHHDERQADNQRRRSGVDTNWRRPVLNTAPDRGRSRSRRGREARRDRHSPHIPPVSGARSGSVLSGFAVRQPSRTPPRNKICSECGATSDQQDSLGRPFYIQKHWVCGDHYCDQHRHIRQHDCLKSFLLKECSAKVQQWRNLERRDLE